MFGVLLVPVPCSKLEVRCSAFSLDSGGATTPTAHKFAAEKGQRIRDTGLAPLRVEELGDRSWETGVRSWVLQPGVGGVGAGVFAEAGAEGALFGNEMGEDEVGEGLFCVKGEGFQFKCRRGCVAEEGGEGLAAGAEAVSVAESAGEDERADGGDAAAAFAAVEEPEHEFVVGGQVEVQLKGVFEKLGFADDEGGMEHGSAGEEMFGSEAVGGLAEKLASVGGVDGDAVGIEKIEVIRIVQGLEEFGAEAGCDLVTGVEEEDPVAFGEVHGLVHAVEDVLVGLGMRASRGYGIRAASRLDTGYGIRDMG
jgi:hypothetical protein